MSYILQLCDVPFFPAGVVAVFAVGVQVLVRFVCGGD